MKESFFLGVAATVIAGVAVWMATNFLEYSLDPRPRLEWASHNQIELPIDGAVQLFSVYVKNTGGATARNVSFIFAEEPETIVFRETTRSSLGANSGFVELSIPAIGANSSADFVVVGLLPSQIVEVLLDGNPVAPVELSDPDASDNLWYAYLGLIIGFLSAMIINRGQVVRERRYGKAEAEYEAAMKSLNGSKAETDQMLAELRERLKQVSKDQNG